MLVVEDLKSALPELTLDVRFLCVEQGTTFVLLGPTGAGKSTLLETLAGFRSPGRGRILINGTDVTNLAPVERRISILFQEDYLFPHLDVRKNICYAADNPSSFEEIVGVLDLQRLISKSVRSLSGGERQLVALGRALMARPRILLLDEPFSAIDPQSRRMVIDGYRRVQRAFGTTTLIVTHNFEDGLSLGHRFGILMRGKLVQTGRAQDVFTHPATADVARFLGAENLFSGVAEFGDTEFTGERGEYLPALFKTEFGTLHVLSDHEGPGYALVPPQDITLSLSPISSSALNQLQGTIVKIRPRGSIYELEIDAGLTFKVLITAQSLRDMSLEVGTKVHLSFKASAVKTY